MDRLTSRSSNVPSDDPSLGWSRREVLRAQLTLAGAALSSSAVLPGWLQAAAPKVHSSTGSLRRLIVVELRGGNDALNTVIPIEDDAYYRARPTIAIPKEQALRLDDLRGLHPSLSALAHRYQSGQVAMISGVGMQNPNMSHFRSQDIWETARTSEPLPDRGWLGRFADVRSSASNAVIGMVAAGQDTIPLALAAYDNPTCAIPQLDGYRLELAPTPVDAREAEARERALLALLRSPDSSATEQELIRATETARAAVRQMEGARHQQTVGDYPSTRLGRDLKLVASTIAARIPATVFHVVQNGYDTHTSQVGTHAELLGTLDLGLDALMNDLESSGVLDDTLVMTTSEFGRRVAENGIGKSAGTDHGAASIMMLLGGKVRGGFHGDPIDLDSLDEDGNARASVDFREAYAAVLRDHLECDPALVLGEEYATNTHPLEVIG